MIRIFLFKLLQAGFQQCLTTVKHHFDIFIISDKVLYMGKINLATIAGVVGGALAGNAVQNNMGGSVRDIYRVTVQLQDGSQRSSTLATAPLSPVPSPGAPCTGSPVA